MPSSNLAPLAIRWVTWLSLLACTGCSVGPHDPQRLAYRQRLELGVATPDDVQRFKTPDHQQQALVASAQDSVPQPHGAIEVELRAAASAGNTAVIKKLLSRSAHVNATDASGNSALQLAAREGHTEAVRLLIKGGALVDGRDGALSPLAAAALGGHLPTVRLLLQSGADVDATGLGGQAPLLLAVKLKRLETAQLLMKSGANTQVQDRSGYGLLMVAVNEYHPEMLSLLLTTGMNPNQPDSSGLTPLYWTDYLKLDDLSRRLRAAGGHAKKQASRSALSGPFETGGY